MTDYVRLAVSRDSICMRLCMRLSCAKAVLQAQEASTIGSSSAPPCGSLWVRPGSLWVRPERGAHAHSPLKPYGTRALDSIYEFNPYTVRSNVYRTPGRFRWRKRAARPGARLRSRGRTSLAARLGRGPHRTAPRCQLRRAGGGRDGRARLID